MDAYAKVSEEKVQPYRNCVMVRYTKDRATLGLLLAFQRSSGIVFLNKFTVTFYGYTAVTMEGE